MDRNLETKNKEMKLSPLNPMLLCPRFAHITEKSFNKLDLDSLKNCREVSRSWENYIDDQNILWNKILENQDTNKTLQLACKNDHIKMVKTIIQKSNELSIDLNAKVVFGWTAFQFACINDNFKIAELFVQKSAEFNIDLNAKYEYNSSATHFACHFGNLEIVEMLVQKSSEFSIDLNAKNGNDLAPFHLACRPRCLCRNLLNSILI